MALNAETNFSLERVNKAPASFDTKKLMSFQDRYMQALPAEEKILRMLPYLQRAGIVDNPIDPEVQARLARVVQAASDRIKVSGDILGYDDFFIADERLAYDEKAFDKRLRSQPEGIELLRKFRKTLAVAPSFDPDALEKLLHDFVQAEGIEVGQIIHALRVAVTGKSVGFGLFDTLSILGRESSLKRIDLALTRL